MKKRGDLRFDLLSENKTAKSKAQVTIWIIISILIVAAIILFFILSQKVKIIDIIKPTMPSVQGDIEKCAIDAAKEAINIMLLQGGYINPENYKLYEDNKVAYLCYNNQYYYPCINQEPMYIEFLEKEINKYIKPKIEDCFYALKQDYTDRGYAVNDAAMSLNVKLNPKQVDILINKKIEISKEETKSYNSFKMRFSNPLYDLAVVAQEIASQEAKYCYFEYLGYSLLYPKVEISKDNVGSEDTASKIYSIQDKISGKKLLIAIRSCAMPGGL